MDLMPSKARNSATVARGGTLFFACIRLPCGCRSSRPDSAPRDHPVVFQSPSGPAGNTREWVLTDRLQAVNVPLMMVWGGRDPYFPVSQAKRAQMLIPDSRLRVFDCTCHAPQREFAEEFHQAVDEFLIN